MSCILNNKFTRNGANIESDLHQHIYNNVLKSKPHLILETWNKNNTEKPNLKSIDDITTEHITYSADYFYSHFKSKAFKDKFGDWQHNPDSIQDERLYGDKDEPKLKYDRKVGSYYFLDKNYNKDYFPVDKDGLSYIFTNIQRKEAISAMVAKFFDRNISKDYRNQNFLQESGLEGFINDLLGERADAIYDKRDALEEKGLEGLIAEHNKPYTQKQYNAKLDGYDKMASDIIDSTYYTKQWVEEFKEKLSQLNYKVTESISEDDINVEEESSNSEIKRKVTATVDTKDAANANIRILLSSIRHHKDVDSVFNEPVLVDFDTIWKKLIHQMVNVPVIVKDGKHVDNYDVMYDKISVLAKKLPYLNQLLEKLDSPEFTEERKSEFVQALNNGRSEYITTTVTVRTDSVGMKVQSMSDVNSIHRNMQKQWGTEFKDIFTTLNDKGKLVEETEDLKYELKAWEEVRDEIKNTKEAGEAIKNESILRKLVWQLQSLGVYGDDEKLLIRSFVGDVNNVSPEEVDSRLIKLVNDAIYMLKGTIGGYKAGARAIDKIDITKSNPFHNQNTFKELAKEAELLSKKGTTSVLINDGKKYWVYTNPSFTQNTINAWKLDLDQLELLYNSDPDKKSSQWLKYLLAYGEGLNEFTRILTAKERVKRLKLDTFNSLQNEKTETTPANPVNNQSISRIDYTADSIYKVTKAKIKGAGNSIYNTPVPADKGTQLALELGYFLDSGAKMVDGKITLNNNVIDTFYGYFESEYMRMNRELRKINTKDAKMYAHFILDKDTQEPIYYEDGKLVGNAFKSQMFDILSHDYKGKNDKVKSLINKMYDDNTGAPLLHSEEALATYKAEIRNVIEHGLSEIIKTTKDNLTKNEFFTKNYIPNNLKRAYDETLENYEDELISDYVVNSLISNIEYAKLFTGEVYNYKNAADYVKRIPGTYTDGMYPRMKVDDPLHFNISVMNNVVVTSQFLQEIKDSYGEEVAGFYKNIDSTDAQAWITPDRWKFLTQRLGLWHDTEHPNVYDKLIGENKNPLTKAEAKLAAQPLKGVYFDEGNGNPVFLKYSQSVLGEGITANNSLSRVYEAMKKAKVDELVTVSAIKVGANIPVTIHTKEGKVKDEVILDNVMQLNNRSWKLQQNLPVKNTKETLVGSQIQKNALMGLKGLENPNFDMNGKALTSDEMYNSLNQVIGALSTKGLESIIADLGITEDDIISNPEAMYDQLLKEAKKRNYDKNLILALQKQVSLAGIPQSYNKFMNMFASMVNNRIVRIKTNGGSFIQVANFGYDDLTNKDKDGIKWLVDQETGLRPPLVDKETKTITPGQIFLPESYLKAYFGEDVDISKLSGEQIKEIVDSRAFKNIIGYRIPNQALASNDALEIVGILPDSAGDSVIAYTEIPTKTGSDFDIDKMYLMLPTLKYSSETRTLDYVEPSVDEEGIELGLEYQPKAVLQNKLIEHYKAIFTHPEVATKMMTPIDYPHVKDHIKAMFEEQSEQTLGLFSPMKQIDVKFSFMAGKAGIGQTANMLVDHARGMFTDNYFKDYYLGWGNKVGSNTVLDEVYSEELSKQDLAYIRTKKKLGKAKSKYAISDSISAFLNAFVDIAKDDYVTRGNWSTQTTNTGLTMLRAGVNPFITNAFIGQPVIKQYIDFIINNESKLADNNRNMDTEFKKQLINSALDNRGDLYSDKKSIKQTQLLKLSKEEGNNALEVLKAKYQSMDEANIQKAKVDLEFIANILSTMNDNSHIDVTQMSLQELEDQIKSPDVAIQMEVYQKFREILEVSKNVVDNIKLMKTDTSGMGKDLSSLFIQQNLFDYIVANEDNKPNALMNIKNKLRDPKTGKLTMVGHYFMNAIHKMDKVTKANPKYFLTANKNIQDTFNNVSYMLKNQPLIDQKLADKLSNSYYSYMMSDFDLLENEDYMSLFTDLASEIISYKKDENTARNYFLDNIEIVEDGKYKFLRINNITKTENTRNDLYSGWRDLMDENPELAKKLTQYSYYSSGFTTNMYEFFSSIPHEMLLQNNINNFVQDYHKKIDGIQNNFIDQFFRHNMADNQIVPKVVKSKKQAFKGMNAFVYENKFNNPLSPYLKDGNKLYKKLGYDNKGSGVYVETQPLGLQTNEGKIYEYSHDTNVESKVNEFDRNLEKKNTRELFNSIVAYPVDHFSDNRYAEKLDFKEEIKINNITETQPEVDESQLPDCIN